MLYDLYLKSTILVVLTCCGQILLTRQSYVAYRYPSLKKDGSFTKSAQPQYNPNSVVQLLLFGTFNNTNVPRVSASSDKQDSAVESEIEKETEV
jgi:hypothetical protein